MNDRTITRPVLPYLTRTEAQARNILAQHALRLTLSLGQEWHARLSLLAPGEPAQTFATPLLLGAEWAGARFCLALPEAALSAWTRSAVELPGLLSDIPEPLALASLELLLADLTSSVERLGRGRIHLTRLEHSTAGLNHRLLLTLQQVDGAEVIHGVMHADSLGLMVLSSLAQAAPAAGNTLDLSALPMPLRLVIGDATLRASELQALAPHDVIWLSSRSGTDGGNLFIAVGAGLPQLPLHGAASRFGFSAQMQDGRLTVLESLRQIMSDNPTAPPGDKPLDIGQVPIHVTFELGERIVTLHELQTLQPGQVFDLGRVPDGAVTIRANGAVIGHGALVEIEQRIGVAVVALAQTATAASPGEEE
ncbi:type III secretion system cytoplasmic ring protein SctQ [Noviherbaspirillum sp. CPCC 100848]|uniref:Type III secretion system cytoplasmic ring protein SctQ n=1 Tax=Noviherbaspirillum album TaxID=3080276 RepID=A0ABU6JAP6_9BURK|nr:type III secretion system cytoplasmic ring protein SctQ [Noviherbaspirillum sp. CPCC 100848]MEC4720722.1 type III secretion system cytoplasmic ring protein SctQ [Noviherbaspirillum sp. CPCC 100848]